MSNVSISIITRNKWPLVFALSALIVTIAGFTAVEDAHAQFGPINKLADPNKTTEFHCGAAGMMPPGNSTSFGGKNAPCIDPGDTSFMYTAAVFVMIMTPGGVGFLYGGMTRRKNALTIILQNFFNNNKCNNNE